MKAMGDVRERTPLNRKRIKGGIMSDSGLLTIQEMAEYLGISERTVMRMDQTGKLPTPIQLGRCKRWNRRELGVWLDYGSPPRIKWQVVWQELRDQSKST